MPLVGLVRDDDHQVMQPSSIDPLSELTTRECRERLRSADLGRLAITFRALPVVIPVKIVMDEMVVGVSSLYGDAIPLPVGSIVALEAGTLGEGRPDEWSVEIRGVLTANSDSGPRAIDAEFLVSTEMITGWARR